LKRWSWLFGSVALVILGFLVGGLFTRKLRQPGEKIKKELAVMKAGADAAAHAVTENSEAALVAIEKAERITIESLDDTRHAKYKELRESGNPERVMRHLERYADPGRRKRYTRG